MLPIDLLSALSKKHIEHVRVEQMQAVLHEVLGKRASRMKLAAFATIVTLLLLLVPMWRRWRRSVQIAMNNSGWQKARKWVGLTQVRIHDLKHAFGRRLRAAMYCLKIGRIYWNTNRAVLRITIRWPN
jgi:hypothetical protein